MLHFLCAHYYDGNLSASMGDPVRASSGTSVRQAAATRRPSSARRLKVAHAFRCLAVSATIKRKSGYCTNRIHGIELYPKRIEVRSQPRRWRQCRSPGPEEKNIFIAA